MPRDLAGRRGRTREGAKLLVVVKTKKDKPPDELLDQYITEYEDWDEQTLDDRDESIRARDFYDGVQWTGDEIDELNERRQPILTNNLIAPKINFLLGSETENRVAPKALPRTFQHDQDADIVTDCLRYASEADYFGHTASDAAANMIIEGYGGAVFRVEHFMRGDEERTRIICEHIPWDRIYYDPRSRRHDFEDAKYLGIVVWMHKEDAEERFCGMLPEDSEEYTKILGTLESAYTRTMSSNDSTDDAPRDFTDDVGRVQFFETYRFSEGVWTRALWTYAGWIEEPAPVDFVDEDGQTWCPLVLDSGFVDRDNARYGIVKHMISPQEEINKRASKALHLMHATRIIIEDGAVQSPDEFVAQLARPDGAATVLPGRLSSGAVQVQNNVELAQAQLGMAARAEAAIAQIGPHGALVASDQRVQSGRSFIARQQAGAMEIKPVFDHISFWKLRCYKRYWWLIRQFWTEQMWFRVTDDALRRGYRFMPLNRRLTKGQYLQELVQQGMPEMEALVTAMGPDGPLLFRRITEEVQAQQAAAQQQAQMMQQQGVPPQQIPQPPQQDPKMLLLQTPLAQEEFTINDVAQLDVDIVLDLEPATPIVRQEQFSELVNLASTTMGLIQNPEITQKMLALIFQHSELRAEEKRQFAEALMPKGPTPEEQAAQQQMQQMQQLQLQQMQVAIQEMQAKMQKMQSETVKNQAQAQKLAQEAQLTVPTLAQFQQAQAVNAAAKAQKVPQEAQLLQAQTTKTLEEAKAVSAEPKVPAGTERP